jgi:hypothetical protein
MGNRRKRSVLNAASKDKGFYDPMAVTWMEKYSGTLDKIWAKLPNCVGSIIVTLAVFAFGATIRGMFFSLNATDHNSNFSSSRAVEYTVLESQHQLHSSEYLSKFELNFFSQYRSKWPCGLRPRSTSARIPRLWVRIPPGEWMFVCCECCVLSGRGLYDELIIRSERSYRLPTVVRA